MTRQEILERIARLDEVAEVMRQQLARILETRDRLALLDPPRRPVLVVDNTRSSRDRLLKALSALR